MIHRIVSVIDRISAGAGYISAGFMLLIVILITSEIVLRTLFGVSTLIADEYSAYFFVAVVLLGLAHTFKAGAHIQITLISGRLAGRAGQVLELVVTVIAFAICSFALYHAVLMVWDTRSLEMTADSISETPIWIPQLSIPIGLVIFDLQLVARFLRRLSSSPTR